MLDLAEEYMDVRKKEQVSWKTIDQTNKALVEFIAFNVGTETVTQSLLRQWVQSLKDRQLASSTVRAWVIQVKRFFRWLRENGSIEGNPWDGLTLSYGKRTLKRETFSKDEYELMKKRAYGSSWYYAVIVGWNTGLRMVDVANLRFEDINYEEQFIACTPRKTKRTGLRVTIPFTSGSDISKLLYQLRGLPPDDSGYLCPVLQAMTDENLGGYQAVMEFNRWLRRKCQIRDKTFHTFRRTFITRMISSGVESEVAIAMCGIKDRSTLDHYYVPNLAALKNAILKVKQ